jgi:hypothetical protein
LESFPVICETVTDYILELQGKDKETQLKEAREIENALRKSEDRRAMLRLLSNEDLEALSVDLSTEKSLYPARSLRIKYWRVYIVSFNKTAALAEHISATGIHDA